MVDRTGAILAEGALEGADDRASLIGGQVPIAGLAIGAHLKHGPSYPRHKKGATLRQRLSILMASAA
ncbi:hypothetical protein [Henriciella algicola]|uniref:hypothetical protein n=1 Tax=Henriciella algicola TaxID=1608422 RepID=UPI001F47433F|nr:hypothetical protein [Henriciella algicola]|tara:strand:- start:417 stop:617 length:201 start_codon:yes stop_codon:yes gene_type:complete